MILKRISILNYKNLEQVELAFSPKLNTFFGQNGMGKTNLLDAVYFLSFCKSAGNPIDSQNIRHHVCEHRQCTGNNRRGGRDLHR
mgnify:CR=1 FL=1